MNRYAILKVALILILFGIIMITSFANSNHHDISHLGPPPADHYDTSHLGTPPAEAIEACKSKAIGDRVKFNNPQGFAVNADCRKINGQLAAVPEEIPPKRPPEPMK